MTRRAPDGRPSPRPGGVRRRFYTIAAHATITVTRGRDETSGLDEIPRRQFARGIRNRRRRRSGKGTCKRIIQARSNFVGVFFFFFFYIIRFVILPSASYFRHSLKTARVHVVRERLFSGFFLFFFFFCFCFAHSPSGLVSRLGKNGTGISGAQRSPRAVSSVSAGRVRQGVHVYSAHAPSATGTTRPTRKPQQKRTRTRAQQYAGNAKNNDIDQLLSRYTYCTIQYKCSV